MEKLLYFQCKFNEMFNLEEFKKNTEKYLFSMINDKNSIIFEDCDEKEIQKIDSLKIEYDSTNVYINDPTTTPSFIIKYNLYDDIRIYYTYEAEYNLYGEELDDYFLEVEEG